MAEGISEVLNVSDVASGLWKSMRPSLTPIITILAAIGIALLVYIIFLIIRAIFKMRTMHKISRIAEDVHAINEKMDILIGKKHKEIKENKKIKEKKEKVK